MKIESYTCTLHVQKHDGHSSGGDGDGDDDDDNDNIDNDDVPYNEIIVVLGIW